MSQDNIIFAYMIPPGAHPTAALLLPESLRRFGGAMAGQPVWAFLPQLEQTFPEGVWERLIELEVQTLPFQLPPYALGFPFAAKVQAAGLAEQQAENQADLLCWMDHDTLFVQEPAAFSLPNEKILGCCPVHHKLIGSPYDHPPDAFWRQVYEHCQVPAGKFYPMTSVVDGQVLRPYYNAGLLVVRPEALLLRAWQGAFSRFHLDPAYQAFYQQHDLYRIFAHQAFLAGMILKHLDRHEIQELPNTYNYPLHMHQDFPSGLRAKKLNDLQTCRFENIFEADDWTSAFPVEDPLRAWLLDHTG